MDGTKNSLGSATKSVYINMSLATDTTAGTALSELKDRAGHSLGIQLTDKIVAYITQARSGNTKSGTGHSNFYGFNTTKIPVIEDVSIKSVVGSDYAGNLVTTPDGENAVVFETSGVGLNNQITSITFRVTKMRRKAPCFSYGDVSR